MISAISSAIGGLNAATQKLNVSAQNIANEGNSATPSAATDPATQLINAQTASYDAKGSLSVLKVEQNITQSLLDIIS